MSTFEFLFSLFGLLLGFSIAEIAGGFARVYDRRKIQPIGWLAPGLAALLILDLMSFWYAAWFLRNIELKFWVVLAAGVIGLLYYFAATQVFGRQGADEAPSDRVMERRGPIIAAVVAANLILFAPPRVMSVVNSGGAILLETDFWITFAYLMLVSLVAFAPGKMWTGVAIAAAIPVLLGGAAILNY